jgi:hypothetical protein
MAEKESANNQGYGRRALEFEYERPQRYVKGTLLQGQADTTLKKAANRNLVVRDVQDHFVFAHN